MGIGDWAQSPIPNPHFPIKNNNFFNLYCSIFNLKLNKINHKNTNKK